MIPKKYKIAFIFFLISRCIFSQIDTTKKFHIYTSPLQAIDVFSRPMITLGGEYIIFNRLAISAEIGSKYTNMDDYDSTIVTSRGYSYRFELKYYNINLIKNSRLRDYISLEYRYIKDDYNSQFNYYPDSLSNALLIDNYAILKHIYVCNIKYGMVISLNKVLFIEPYSGIGIRYRDVSNVSRTFDEKLGHEHEYPEYFWTISDFDEFSGFKLNISIGLKIGIKL